jgi:hypothetical protein
MKTFKPKFRQSTDTFDANTWYVYKDFGNNNLELVTAVTERSEAQILVNELYKKQISDVVKSLDLTSIVSDEFLTLALSEKIHPLHAVEMFFSENPIDINNLTPLKGNVSDFHSEVSKLMRPYAPIPKSYWDILMKKKSDYYLTTSGKVVTFGNAGCHGSDSNYALMPLSDIESEKIIVKNNI